MEDKVPDAGGLIVREVMKNVPLSLVLSEKAVEVGCLGNEPRRGWQVRLVNFRLAKR